MLELKSKSSKKKSSKIEKLKKKNEKLNKQANKIRVEMEYYKEKMESRTQCVYVYIQFKSMNGAKKFTNAINMNACKRFFAWCCNRNKYKRCGGRSFDRIKHKYIGNQWPNTVETVDPALILWKNLGIGKIDRCTRSLFTYILSFIIILLGFSVIVYTLNYEGNITVDETACGEDNITLE